MEARPARTIPALLPALLVVAVSALAAPDRLYAPLYRDCSLYRGYFLDLPGHLKAFGDLYYSSRLSVTVPGWLAHKALPAHAANAFLHLGLHLAAVVAFFTAARGLFGTRTAALASALFAGHSYLLIAVNSDYGDGFGVAYFLAALAFRVTAGRSPRPMMWTFLAGIATACLVVANLMYAMLCVPLLVFHVALARSESSRVALAPVVAGGLAAVGVFAAVSKLLGGPVVFLLSSLRFAAGFQLKGPNPFKETLADWLPHAGWLVVPAAAVLGAFLFLARTRRDRDFLSPARAAQVPLLLVAGLLLAMDATSRHNMLQLWLYATPLLAPLAWLALCGQWRDALESATVPHIAAAAVLAVVAAVLPILPVPVITPVLAAFSILAATTLLQSRVALVVPAAVVLIAFGDDALRRSFRPEQSLGPNIAAELRMARDSAFTLRRPEVYEAVRNAMRSVRRWDPEYAGYFWFDLDEPLGLVFDNVACLHCWGHRLVNTTFPDAHDPRHALRPDMRLIVPSGDPQSEQRLREALARAGLAGETLRRETFAVGGERFEVLLVETRSADRLAEDTERTP